MTADKIDLGRKGEEIACNFLLKKGYQIKERNWRYKNAEIDIIAFDGKELVIVEVKTRSAVIYEEPRDSITNQKIRFLVNATEAYIYENDFNGETRFDVISIKWFGENKFDLEHYPNAFYPPVG
jgi:putative endonuclease